MLSHDIVSGQVIDGLTLNTAMPSERNQIADLSIHTPEQLYVVNNLD